MARLRLSQEILDIIYPVGCVYFSRSITNPSILFGGTWTRIVDGFIFCSGSQKDINVSQGNLQGGAITNYCGTLECGYTTLTIQQIPHHTHAFYYAISGSGGRS